MTSPRTSCRLGRHVVVLLVLSLSSASLVACSSSPSSEVSSAEAADASASIDGAAEAAASGEGGGAPGGLASSCSGACQGFDVTAQFGAHAATFERGQFGLVRAEDGTASLQVELHAGGNPACPVETSPTPLRTVVIAGLKLPLGAGALTYADGLRVTLFDFDGGLLPGPAPARASAVSLRMRAASVSTAGFAAGDFAAFDLDATFDGGTLTAKVYATRCASMDVAP